MFAQPQGLSALLKEGGKHFTGIDEAVARNIEACKAISTMTKTSLGPNSMNKLIINHIEKHFVTSDTAIILKELDVVHPAAKLLVTAAETQELEFGDATNLVISFAGQLLSQAEELLKLGLHVADVIAGYDCGIKCVEKEMKSLTCWTVSDLKDKNQIKKAVKTCISSKLYGLEDTVSQLVADAVVQVMPTKPVDFDVDCVRVACINGCSVEASFTLDGMVINKPPTGTELKKEKCKVLVLGCGLEMTSTETKGTVLLKNAQELLDFTRGEEEAMERAIKEIVDAGVQVIVAHGTISDIAQHYCNRYKVLTVKTSSKFELRRICRTLGATALVRLGAPTAEEMGYATLVESREIASTSATFMQSADSRVATIVLRGATGNVLEEVERSINDAVQVIRCVTRPVETAPMFVAGGGGCECELATRVAALGVATTGLPQHSLLKFGEALQVVASVLSENTGLNSVEAVAEVLAAHKKGMSNACIDVTAGSGCRVTASARTTSTIDAQTESILDHMDAKLSALRLGTEAALTVLRVDQIIMAKPAGGPKPRDQGAPDDD
eukprot:GHVR01169174.1.p1 GENE.GHVR01169174.1~~GHVR01169174.1.p1  ORF type:complete len:570 (+),score=157.65 GHVR01169174.1:48-1712(+)